MFKRLFPTLAEWPVEKWMALPVAAFFMLGAIGGLYDLVHRGLYEAGYPLF